MLVDNPRFSDGSYAINCIWWQMERNEKRPCINTWQGQFAPLLCEYCIIPDRVFGWKCIKKGTGNKWVKI